MVKQLYWWQKKYNCVLGDMLKITMYPAPKEMGTKCYNEHEELFFETWLDV